MFVTDVGPGDVPFVTDVGAVDVVMFVTDVGTSDDVIFDIVVITGEVLVDVAGGVCASGLFVVFMMRSDLSLLLVSGGVAIEVVSCLMIVL